MSPLQQGEEPAAAFSTDTSWPLCPPLAVAQEGRGSSVDAARAGSAGGSLTRRRQGQEGFRWGTAEVLNSGTAAPAPSPGPREC